MASECMILCRFLGQISDPPMTLLAYLPGWFFIEPCFGYGRGEELKHVFVLWLYKECSSWFTHKPEASPSSPSSPSSKRSNSEDLQCMMDHLHHKFLEKMRHTDRGARLWRECEFQYHFYSVLQGCSLLRYREDVKIDLKASEDVAKDVSFSNLRNVSMSDMILMYEAFSEIAEVDANLKTSEWDLEVEHVELEAQTKDGEDQDSHQYLVKWTDNTTCCEELVVKSESQDHMMVDSTDEALVGQFYLERLWLKRL